MPKAKRTLWTCPSCGRGKLGPQKPRKNNTVRYCLPCSEDVGVLVERTAPALEKKRAAKKARTGERAKKRQTVKKKSADSLYVYGGFDIRKELKRMWKHPEIVAEVGSEKPPRMTVRRRKCGKYSTGVSYGWRFVLTIHEGASPGQALTILAHEVAHEACDRRTHHGDRWRSVFTALVMDLYGADDIRPADDYRDLHSSIITAVDKSIQLTRTG